MAIDTRWLAFPTMGYNNSLLRNAQTLKYHPPLSNLKAGKTQSPVATFAYPFSSDVNLQTREKKTQSSTFL